MSVPHNAVKVERSNKGIDQQLLAEELWHMVSATKSCLSSEGKKGSCGDQETAIPESLLALSH